MRRSYSPLQPLITRDPAGGGELIVTRLESPVTGVTIEGRFSLGWIGSLTREQLDFVGLLLLNRCNVQKLAAELGVAYNTARSRLDDIVEALGGQQEIDRPASGEILDLFASGEIDFDEAIRQLKR